MNTTQRKQSAGIALVQGTMSAGCQESESQHWSQFWPAGSETETGSDALIGEALAGLEREESVQARVAGYRSESQGQ